MTDSAANVHSTWGELSVCALCGGPPQAAFLSATIDAMGVDPSRVGVLLGVQQFDSDLASATGALCRALGWRIVSGGEVGSLLNGLRWKPRPILLLLSRGVACENRILDALLRLRPRRVVEYYDGYRSYVIARQTRMCHLASDPVGPLTRLRIAFGRAARAADGYAMPDDGCWLRYASSSLHDRLIRLSRQHVTRAIERVGQWYDTPVPAYDVIYLTNIYSERSAAIAQADELRLYDAALAAIRQAVPAGRIAIKAHPRTSPVKLKALDHLAQRHGAVHAEAGQLVEYDLLRRPEVCTWVVGGPCTALLNVKWLKCGRAACASYKLLRRYLGVGYKNITWAHEDHATMSECGVSEFAGWTALSQMLDRGLNS